jgi:NADH-quinone oxidoreductase subunit A
LLVGFAYLWRRGDLKWVRSTAAQGEPGTLVTGGG